MFTDTNCDVLLTYPAEKFNIFEYMIPLGLASLGSVLEKNGYSVKIIDFARYRGDFQRDLSKLRPSVVGIGGTTATRKGSFLTARLVKKIFPDIPVVYGGNHASFAAEDTLRHVPYIDLHY
ncbi:MAG: cobalamin-dependent protein [Fibrobacter sp.]|nr:cobalamin-dependent protein [Fibrobacter sp.]